MKTHRATPICLVGLLGAWVGADRLIRELSQHIAEVVDWCSEKTDDSLERWLGWSRWVRAGWDEGLGASEALGHLQTLLLGNVVAEKWQVVLLLFLNVLAQVGHELLDLWDELWRAGLEVLEDFEILLDLLMGLVMYS